MSFALSDFPVGSYWKRSDIHALLGGQEQGGISTPSKKPYIIIHITQLADDGPDAPKDVVAACPTCHRRIHHGAGGDELNAAAHERIKRVEEAIDHKRLVVVTAAVIDDQEGRVLIAKRKHDQHLGSKWEFPGGKVEKGETLQACISREISEELGIQISEPCPFFMVDHKYSVFDIRLCALKASIVGGELQSRDHDAVRWVPPSQLLTVTLAAADVGIAEAIAGMPLESS